MGVDHLGNLGLGFRGEASGKVGLSGLGLGAWGLMEELLIIEFKAQALSNLALKG